MRSLLSGVSLCGVLILSLPSLVCGGSIADDLRSAEQGDAKAQSQLGRAFAEGKGVARDFEGALKWNRLAAEQGEAEGQVGLGVAYRKGQGVQRDYAEALKWFRMAAEQGNARGQEGLGSMHKYGNGVGKDYAKALKWLDLAAQQDLPEAQVDLGLMYARGQGVKKDFAEAVRLFRLAAMQTSPVEPSAYNLLGISYRGGFGVEKDLVKAYMWFSLADAAGHKKAAESRSQVAKTMAQAEVSEARQMAIRWVESRSGNKGNGGQSNAHYQWLLGSVYANINKPDKPNKDEFSMALKWLTSSAEQGYVRAMLDVGNLYMFYTEKHESKDAAPWIQKAAEHFNAEAQFLLGLLFFQGDGVEKDHVKAYMWWILAGKQEHPLAKEMLEKSLDEITPNQVTQAQELARQWGAE